MHRVPSMVCLVLTLFCYGSPQAGDLLPESPAPSDAADRTVLFVSDLHMGVGRDPNDPKSWHPTEDFRWHAEFSAFLDAIERETGGKVDLVLVGDLLELWQVASGSPPCQHDEFGKNWGCSEQEAEVRVRRVVEQHAAVFKRLGKFAQGQNSVTILPGNHDVALAFPKVREIVLGAMSPRSPRIRIATEGYWMSADGKIFAEHGQQIGGDPNRFDGWPLKPFFERDGKQYLEQPWGEEFVQRIFNDKELEFPIIDNLASESLGVRYAAKDLGVRGSLTALGKFARFILLEQSWAQGSQFVGKDPSKAPEWELDKIDVQTSESRWRFVANSLGPGDPLAAQLIESAKDLPEAPPLEQVELKAACDMRWVKQKLNPESGIEPCPHRGDLGGLKLSVESSAAKAARFRERLDKIRTSLPEPMRPTRDFELYVYGHTHKEHGLCSPFDPKAPWKPSVINDGAWQRTASDETFCALIDGKDPKQALRDLRPEDLPPCYPFVTFSSGKANLRYWVQPTGKPGSIRTDCTDLPPIPKHCEEKASDACPAFPVKQANN